MSEPAGIQQKVDQILSGSRRGRNLIIRLDSDTIFPEDRSVVKLPSGRETNAWMKVEMDRIDNDAVVVLSHQNRVSRDRPFDGSMDT